VLQSASPSQSIVVTSAAAAAAAFFGSQLRQRQHRHSARHTSKVISVAFLFACNTPQRRNNPHFYVLTSTMSHPFVVVVVVGSSSNTKSWPRRWLLLTFLAGLLILYQNDPSRALLTVVSASSSSSEDDGTYEAPEPFPVLHGHCATCGADHRGVSPDPLIRTTWSSATNTSDLQLYRIYHPISYAVYPPDALVTGLDSLLLPTGRDGGRTDGSNPTAIVVHQDATIRLDWGVEHTAWLEFQSPNLHGSAVRASLSEFNSPFPDKTRPVKRYGNATYRLETNAELYEGIRYTWLYLDRVASTDPIVMTNVSLVVKVKPINYTGSFQSSDVALTKTWYTGAYGVRLNMEADGFNSVLMERGDRVAIQGDGHPTMAAALVAFAPVYRMIHHVLNQTNSGHVHGHRVVDDTIMAYPLYWTLSVHDWYMASGDARGFAALVPDIRSIVDLRIQDFLDPNLDVTWMGWDDRLGNGWCFHSTNDTCTREGHLTFAALVVRACRDLAKSLKLSGMVEEAGKYQNITAELVRKFRQTPDWPVGLGVHAAANAINAGIATQPEIDAWMKSVLNDSVTICSWSPFNQYWILQGFGNADQMEHALASIQLCWGPMVELGHGCFWELHSPEWSSFMKDGDLAPTMPSYCHPWSSGVTAWLSHVHGGITPLLPGYREFAAAPYVSERYPTVSTQMPTPLGVITVNATLSFDRAEGAAVLINVTSAVPGYVGLRESLDSGRCSLTSISVNGLPVVAKRAEQLSFGATSLGAEALNDHFLPSKSFTLGFVYVSPFDFTLVKATYSGSCRSPTRLDHQQYLKSKNGLGIPHRPPFPEPKYPSTVKIDRTSRGDGIYNYGSDGYQLLAYYANGTDLIGLPPYIASISIREHGFDGWSSLQGSFVGSSTNNPTYVPNPQNDKKAKKRSLGALGHGSDMHRNAGVVVNMNVTNGGNALHSILIDIQRKSTQLYSISLYCVGTNEKFAVRVLDLDTLNVIAPTAMISDYKNGVWWSLKYDNSVRLRLMSIYGVHISAVAFSSASSQTAET
jgi:alpha-L-rhamnosidase